MLLPFTPLLPPTANFVVGLFKDVRSLLFDESWFSEKGLFKVGGDDVILCTFFTQKVSLQIVIFDNKLPWRCTPKLHPVVFTHKHRLNHEGVLTWTSFISRISYFSRMFEVFCLTAGVLDFLKRGCPRLEVMRSYYTPLFPKKVSLQIVIFDNKETWTCTPKLHLVVLAHIHRVNHERVLTCTSFIFGIGYLPLGTLTSATRHFKCVVQ